MLSLSSFLLLHFLDISSLKLFLGIVNLLISSSFILSSLSLDLIETHTDDSFLNSGSSLSSLLLNVLDLDLLVVSSGSLGPSELNWLDFLMEESSSFGADEKVDFSVFGCKS